MLVEERPRRAPEPPDLAGRDNPAPHVLEGGGAAHAKDLGDLVGREQFVACESEWAIHRPYRRYARPRGRTASTSMTFSSVRRSKITRHSPTRRRHRRSGPCSRLTSPSGSSPMATAILCRSLRPSRRSDLSAAGRTSIRQAPGSASVQLRLDLRPADAGFLPRLFNGPTVLVGHLLIVERRSVELGDDRVLGAPEENRRRRQRFIGKRVDEAMKLGLGHSRKVAPPPSPSQIERIHKCLVGG